MPWPSRWKPARGGARSASRIRSSHQDMAIYIHHPISPPAGESPSQSPSPRFAVGRLVGAAFYDPTAVAQSFDPPLPPRQIGSAKQHPRCRSVAETACQFTGNVTLYFSFSLQDPSSSTMDCSCYWGLLNEDFDFLYISKNMREVGLQIGYSFVRSSLFHIIEPTFVPKFRRDLETFKSIAGFNGVAIR